MRCKSALLTTPKLWALIPSVSKPLAVATSNRRSNGCVRGKPNHDDSIDAKRMLQDCAQNHNGEAIAGRWRQKPQSHKHTPLRQSWSHALKDPVEIPHAPMKMSRLAENNSTKQILVGPYKPEERSKTAGSLEAESTTKNTRTKNKRSSWDCECVQKALC